ncbi:hypothetical protein [Agarilytica rhodophyticola]|uniref:hypothetical protein n=1 Tax=Agarilytica rhodophyticola TaxID=1737490 RepID=UPI000B3448B6|nr:hypothetical protein [Agarilytica rhodophyticola]
MNIKVLFPAVLSFFITSNVQADKQPPVMEEILNQPETQQFSGSEFMECFVDTPALDQFTRNVCFSVANARTTTAVFRIQGGPSSNFRVIWSDSRCSQNSKSCSLPIFQYRSISISADVLNLSNNQFFSVSAQAFYEGFN